MLIKRLKTSKSNQIGPNQLKMSTFIKHFDLINHNSHVFEYYKTLLIKIRFVLIEFVVTMGIPA